MLSNISNHWTGEACHFLRGRLLFDNPRLYTSVYGLSWYCFLLGRSLYLLILPALWHSFLHSDIVLCSASQEHNSSCIVNWNLSLYLKFKHFFPSCKATTQQTSRMCLCSLNIKRQETELKSSVAPHWRR